MSYAATDQPLGTLETVATFHGPMPTGVTVSHSGRIFVNFPKWGDDVTATVAEVRDGQCVPFPDQASNSPPATMTPTRSCRCKAWWSTRPTGCGCWTPAARSSN